MKIPKSLLTALKSVGTPSWVVLGISILLLAVGAYVVWRGKKKASKQADDGAVEATSVPSESPKKFEKNALRDVWRGFLSGQRPEYRHVLPAFQPVVFLGNHAVASRELISTYTVWEMLRQQGRNSETKDSNLHLYVDTTSVVQDIQPHVAVDRSAEALSALERLWRETHARPDAGMVDRLLERNRSRHAAIAVVALSWGELMQGSDKATTWAQQARGKIDQLRLVTNKNVEVRVALMGLSAHANYGKFLNFAEEHCIELVMAPKAFDRGSLRVAFADLASYSSLALTEMPAADYREAMDFLEDFPKQLEKLSSFMGALLRADALSPSPSCSGIYLCNEGGAATQPLALVGAAAGARRGANPLNVDGSKIEQPKRGPHFWHKVAAAAIAGAFILTTLIVWAHERSLWLDAEQAAAQYELTETAVVHNKGTKDESTHQEFAEESSDYGKRQLVSAFVEQEGHRAFFPGFYDDAIPSVQDRFSEKVRLTAFEPLVKESIRSHELAHQRVLYLLALMHACQGNEDVPANGLAAYAVHRTDTWSSELGLPQELLDQYLSWSREGRREAMPLPNLDDGRESSEQFRQAWIVQFESLKDVTSQQAALDSGMLLRLRQKGVRLRELLKQSDRFGDAPQVIEKLKFSRPCSGSGAGDDITAESDSDSNHRALSPWWPSYRANFVSIEPMLVFQSELRNKQAHLRQVLDLVENTSLTSRGAQEARKLGKSAALSSLLQAIQDIEAGALLPEEPPEIISAEGQWYDFDVSGWAAAVKYNGHLAAIDQFLNATADADPERMFFGAVDTRDLGRCHIMLNAGARGEDFFTGKADIPCEYTRAGFEKYLVPQLTKLVNLRSVVGAGRVGYERAYKELYERLDAHLLRAFERYASSYRTHWLTYFERFGMRATSVEQLMILLRRLESPTSPLQEVMDKLLRNVRIDSPPDLRDYLEPLESALNKEFEPLLNLKMAEYLAFVTALRETLEAAAPEEEKADADAGTASVLESSETLDAALSPAGKVALATLLGEAGSQNTLIRKWLRETNIARYGNNPFDDPFNDINRLGMRNVRNTLRTAWRTSFETEVAPIFQTFPFNPGAAREAEPAELNRLFTPETGLFFSLVQRYIMPVARKDNDRGYGPRNSAIARAKLVPERVYATINNVAKLSKTLWDDKGAPRNYSIPFYGEPMPVGNRIHAVLSLAYLREGDRSLVNFNQARIAVRKVLEVDWNTPSAAQVGVRLTSVDTKEDSYPRGLASEKKYWSLLHLLRRRHRLTAVEVAKLPRLPRGHKRYAFRFVLGSEQGGGSLTVSFVAEHDPFLMFRRLAYSGSIWE